MQLMWEECGAGQVIHFYLKTVFVPLRLVLSDFFFLRQLLQLWKKPIHMVQMTLGCTKTSQQVSTGAERPTSASANREGGPPSGQCSVRTCIAGLQLWRRQ